MPALALSGLVPGLRSANWRLSPSVSGIGAGVLVAVAYYIGCQAGFALRFPSSGIAYIWPPNAILVASLLLAPTRFWSLILGAAFAAHGFAHARDGLPALTWLCQFLGNGLQAVLAAGIVLRFTDRSLRFNRLRYVAVFIVGAAFVAPAIGSLVPAFVYVRMGWASDYWAAWGVRTLTNVVTTVTLVPPLLLIFGDASRLLKRVTPGRAAEFTLLMLGLFAVDVDVVAFAVQGANYSGFLPTLYAPLPFLIWAAVRFGPAGLSVCLLGVAWISIRAALSGSSPFAGATPVQTAVAVQMFVGIWTLPLMLMSALLEECRDAQQILVTNQERLAIAQDARNAAAAERSRTEEALRRSEAKSGAILQAIPDLMFVQSTDATHRYLDYYAKNLNELLAPPGQFLGKAMRDVLPGDLAESFESLFEQTVVSGEPGLLEYSLPIGGKERHYEARVVACGNDTFLSIVRDITDRKRIVEALRVSEQRYALATAAGGVGVWDWNLETNEIYVDPELKGLLGFADHEIQNHLDDWGRRVHPDDAGLVMTRAHLHTDGRAPLFDAEHRMIHKDGSIRWFLARGALVSSEHGRPVRMIGTDTDITDRKLAEAALHKAQQELMQLSRANALGELAASIAHEVNQPLTAIAANAAACMRWVEDGSLGSGQVREALGSIVDDANRASTVIRRTRELFRRGPHEKVLVELNAAITEVLALTRRGAERGGISVRLELAEAGLSVMGDQVQLQQVLLNLIVNGVDAMRGEPGGSRVLIVRSWRDEHLVHVSVRDSGRGFDQQDVERIFDPFYTTKPQGMGIGLAISRSIIRAHGGELLAGLNEDGGATFHFTVPAAGG